MCGLTGFWQSSPLTDGATRLAETMADQIASRGPDDSGVWIDAEAGIALAHRRLSIIDLSEAGHQPMISPSGRFVMAYNGEIYNHQDMRCQLDGAVKQQSIRWRGHSDTETLLAGFDLWGIEETLKRSAGMFAVALWDRTNRTLYLARDRIGEKPLYYGWQGDALLFGSTLNAIRIHPAFRNEIDRNALTLFLRHNYIPAPYSIYRGIQKLPPGTFLALPMGRQSQGTFPAPIAYWRLGDVVADALQNPFAGNESEAVAMLDEKLRSAVALQMVADVPLGAFLSGGIDSSTIVALMQAQSTRRVKTFTIGFYESEYNEADKAAAVARHLGTEHTELYVTPETAQKVIPLLPELYDEPFADSSQIPTFLVSKLAQQHVKVSLSGDAGDELFGGYPRYSLALAIWSKIARVPALGRRLPMHTLGLVPAAAWNNLDVVLRRLSPKHFAHRPVRSRIIGASQLLAARDRSQLYHQIISAWKTPANVVIGAHEPPTVLTARDAWPETRDFADEMMYLDAMSYLPDDILAKVDRAAMAVSLETRVPFLDHRVIEFAWKLPLSLKMREGQGKWILRKVLDKYVPRDLYERPKMGFGVPIDEWLRGPLRDWAETLLGERRLKEDGFFQPEPILEKFREHVSSQFNWHSYLWTVLMFQAWLDQRSTL